MAAKYLIRLDDAHPRMHRERWGRVQDICLKFNIKPMIAVIPDNKDKGLIHSPVDQKFWSDLFSKKNIGWIIGLHGYQHNLRLSSKGLVPINDYSEFTNIDMTTQGKMISKGLKILRKYNLEPEVWIAPAHGFDRNTIRALVQFSSIRTISDGLSIRPFARYGMNWIPQQLWKGRDMWLGTWTLCLHPSDMSDEQIDSFERFVKKNQQKVVSVKRIIFAKFSLIDWIVCCLFSSLLMTKRLAKKLSNLLMRVKN